MCSSDLDIGGLLLGIAERAVEIGILGTGLGHWVLPREKCRGTTPDWPKGSANRNVYGVAGLFRQPILATEGRDMDEPKRQQPEIPPPPITEPQRSLPEIPPGIDPPQKSTPTTGEN